MTRGRLLALVLAPTLVLGLVVGGFVVVDARAQQADVDLADAAAARYQQQVSSFRAAVVQDLEAADATDPADVADVLEEHRDDLPELEATPERGEAGSAAYATARSEQAALAEALDRLDAVVTSSRGAETFLTAAERALEVDPSTLAPGAVVTSGDPLRTQLLPPMRTALAAFEAVEAPDDAQDARDAVRAALQHVIAEGERLAAQLDAGRSGSFQYAEEYTAARTAVQQYADKVGADLREALDGVVADRTVQS